MKSGKTDTRERLLDAAEHLYADRGINGTSLREVTAEADANLAAVHYYFGSKEALTDAVFARRLKPLNRERLRLLDALEAEAGDQPVKLENILEAFIEPVLQMSYGSDSGWRKFIRLMSRIYYDPSLYQGRFILDQFREISRRFTLALGKALPHLGEPDIAWRFHFTIGAMVHTVSDPAKLAQFTGGLCDPRDTQTLKRQLVTFATRGLQAPPAQDSEKTTGGQR